MKIEKLGTVYGGWIVPTEMELDENSIIYSGGVGEDMSFDILLQNKYNCNILLIDPTEKAIKHYKEVQEYYNNNKMFTGNIQNDYYTHISNKNNTPPNFNKMIYLPIGLWKEETELKFYKQNNENYVSQSLVENMFGNNSDIVKVNTIRNIMEEHCHDKIDLLKLDIEGAEIEVLNKMLDDKIYPKYLLIEFDLLLKNKDPKNSTKQLIERMITKENYKILKNDNLNITFIHN